MRGLLKANIYFSITFSYTAVWPISIFHDFLMTYFSGWNNIVDQLFFSFLGRKFYNTCTKLTKYAQNSQNLQNVHKINKIYKIYKMCTKLTKCAQDLQNVHKIDKMCTKFHCSRAEELNKTSFQNFLPFCWTRSKTGERSKSTQEKKLLKTLLKTFSLKKKLKGLSKNFQKDLRIYEE